MDESMRMQKLSAYVCSTLKDDFGVLWITHVALPSQQSLDNFLFRQICQTFFVEWKSDLSIAFSKELHVQTIENIFL